jgi:hypothetical protein
MTSAVQSAACKPVTCSPISLPPHSTLVEIRAGGGGGEEEFSRTGRPEQEESSGESPRQLPELGHMAKVVVRCDLGYKVNLTASNSSFSFNTHTHTHTHTLTFSLTHTQTHTQTHTHTHSLSLSHTHKHTHKHTQTKHMYICTYAHICIHTKKVNQTACDTSFQVLCSDGRVEGTSSEKFHLL